MWRLYFDLLHTNLHLLVYLDLHLLVTSIISEPARLTAYFQPGTESRSDRHTSSASTMEKWPQYTGTDLVEEGQGAGAGAEAKSGSGAGAEAGAGYLEEVAIYVSGLRAL